MVMRKLYYLSMFAVAAMAAFSCTKELKDNNKPEKDFEPKVISAFTDDDVKSDTKTSLSGVSVLWATTDNIKGWDGSAVHTSTSTAVFEGNKKAEFTFDGVSVETNLFTLAYPAEKISNIDDDFVYATIPSVQTATANSFANQANVAVADGLTATPVFKNVGGLLSIIINNDNITSVKLSANESLTGDSKIDMNSSTYEATILTGKKYVTLSGTITNGTEYFAVVYPGTYTGLKIEVTNASGQVATYSNPNSLTVERNGNLHIATLTIPAGKWVTPTKGSEYSWTMASGDFGNSETPATSITKGAPSMSWTADYTFTSANYIGNLVDKGQQFGSGSNPCSALTLSTSGYTQYVESIVVNFSHASSGGAALSVKVGDTTLKNGENTVVNATTTATEYTFNSSSLVKGDIILSFTNGASKAFYVKSIVINPDSRTAQTLSFPESSYSVELSDGTFASPTLSGAQTTVTYSSSNDDVATVNPSTGVVTLKTTGTVNITATAEADATHKEGSASYELTVNPAPSTISDVISAATETTVYTQGVVAQINKKGFIMTDGTDNIFVYQNAIPSVEVGQAVKVRGTRGIYSGVPQIVSLAVTAGATGQSVTRTTITNITSANATGHTYSTYISLSGTLTISGSYVNISIDGSSVKGSLYNLIGTESFSGGDVNDLDGVPVIVTGYIVGSTSSYLYIATVDIDAADYLSTTPANGSVIEWNNDEYGAGNAQTITVTLNGAATGYTVSPGTSAWTVSDNGSGTITVYPNAANESTTDDKTLDVVITHNDDASVTSTISLKQKKQGGSDPTWTRVTSVSQITSGGTFIIGYEDSANSGTLIPLRPVSSGAYIYSGSTSDNTATITMSSTMAASSTADYETRIVAGPSSGTISIMIGTKYIKNNCSYNSTKSKWTHAITLDDSKIDTGFTPTIGDNDVVTLTSTVQVNSQYAKFQYNTSSPRFTCYGTGSQKNLVLYKKGE